MTLRVLGIVVGLGLVVAAPARADIIVQSSDVGACKSAKEGAPCESREADGTCQPSTCSRRDYAKGPPGEMVEYKCLRCMAIATPRPEPAKSTAAPTPAAAAPATAARPAAPAATPRPAAKGTGCQVGGGQLGWVVIGALLVALARRTRRV
jgi:hypothetical protein